MKSLFALMTFATLTVGSAIAAMPVNASSTQQSAAASVSPAIVSMAEQELPFDRYWSKN